MYNGAAILGPAIAGGVTGDLIGLAGKLMEGQISASLQEDAQRHSEYMSQNQMKWNVEQMRDMGFSPMMLFEHGNASGGSASGGAIGKTPSINLGQSLGMINAVGQILKEDAENDLKERKIDLQEQKENRLENREIYQKNYLHDKAEQHRTQAILNNQLHDLRNRNVYSYENRKYTKKQLNDVYDDINTIEL